MRITLLILQCLLAMALEAQTSGSTILASQQRAATLLEVAMRAHGGKDRLERARRFDIRATLDNRSVHQSEDPQPPFREWQVQARYVSDPVTRRFLVDSEATFPSFKNSSRTISVDGQGWLIDKLAQTKVPEPNLGGMQSLLRRILPQNLLLEAATRRGTLRWLSAASESGGAIEVISYARPSGEIVTLSFDAETHLLAKYETLQATMMDGDVAFTHAYLGYRVVDGMQMPTGFEIRRGPWTLTRGTLNAVQLDQPSNDSDFEVPAYRQIASYDPPMQMETLSPGVHVVRYVPGGYNVLCIEFADHLLTMETPEDTSREGVSRQVVDFIHDKFPNKPVRYAVPTHHHVDHVGGARDYVATGATIISTKANEKVIRQLAAQRSTITPDTLDKANLPLKLQFIGESPLKFSDQEQELQVFAIGPTPHVKEILIGYLPKQKILFQTDLFNAWSCFKQQVPNESIGHTTALGDTQALIAAVERLGLEVDRVIGGHGLDVEYTWMKEFTQRRAKDGLPMWACTADEMREAFGATH